MNKPGTQPVQTAEAERAYVLKYFARDARRYDRNEPFRTGLRARVLAAVAPAPGQAVLDVCTGTGGLALAMADHGARVTAVDLSPDMLALARAKDPGARVQFLRADASALPFPDGAFDTCTLYMGLHCMPAGVRAGVLAELGRLASRRVVLLEPNNPRSWPGRWALTTLGRLTDAPRYWPDYVAMDLEGALAAAGLAVERAQVLNLGIHRLTVCRPL